MTDRLFDPEPESGDRPGPALAADRFIPKYFLDRSPRLKAMIIKALEESVEHPVSQPRCTWQGCTANATEWHHEHEREVFGRFAEFGPVNPYCKFHHDLITLMRNASMGRN